MGKKLTTVDVERKIADIHGDTITLDIATYTNTTTKARFIDKDFGEFYSTPKDILAGKTNKKRGKLKYKQTMLEKYGVENPSHLPEIRIKAKATCKERYGTEFPSSLLKFKEKAKSTNLKKYGKIHPLQNKDIIAKQKATVLKIYGVDNVSKAKAVQDIKRQKSLEKYGTEYVLQSEEVKRKIEITILDRYGVDKIGKSPEITKKQVATFNAKSADEIAEIVKKRQNTCLEKYGTKSPLQNKDVMSKMQKTNLARYGTICVLNHPDIQKKARNTLRLRYGVDWPTQSPEIMKKIQETNMRRYGVPWTQQNLEIAKKSARSVNNSCILFNWATKEEVVCVGSYEVAVVNYLNTSKINYLWQPHAFKMENGKVYIPDCYLINEDKWIEIKGYFRKDAQEKWGWFCSKHPKSELWDKTKLKELKII